MHGIREMEDVFADEIAAMTDRRNLLRDHFAGLAMQALIALRLQLPISAECHEAYRYADEMLRAREAGQ